MKEVKSTNKWLILCWICSGERERERGGGVYFQCTEIYILELRSVELHYSEFLRGQT